MIVLVAVGGGVILTYWVVVLPRRLAPPLSPSALGSLDHRDRIELADARVKLRNDLRATSLHVLAAIAVLASAALAFQQLGADREQARADQDLTRQGQASELFSQAVEQLGDERLEVRLGGIYVLDQIAQQVPDNRLAVTEVLVGYLHRCCPKSNRSSDVAYVHTEEVQAAMTVLGRIGSPFGYRPLDLGLLDLRGIYVTGRPYLVDGQRGFRGANFQWAVFYGSDLRGATFSDMYIAHASFDGADLRGANFESVDKSLDIADDFPDRVGDRKDSGIELATFVGAISDASITWPAGFDWRSAGVEIQ